MDDNRDSARTLARLLKLLGHEARTAHDGGEAVEAAEEYRPELMLLDIGLPVMNGYEVARAIRGEPGARGVTIVALTGWGQDGRPPPLEGGRDRRPPRQAGGPDRPGEAIDGDADGFVLTLSRIGLGLRGSGEIVPFIEFR